jgi:4'-phosphopantetheinyl transferase
MNEPTSDTGGYPLLVEWQTDSEPSPLGPDEIRVWIVELDVGLGGSDDADSVEPGPELAILAPDEQARAARFVRARDRRRFVRCRVALRQILGGLVGESAGSIRFRSRGQGKPELDHAGAPDNRAGGWCDLRFNVSHSAELALIAVCRGRELGVDVERLRSLGEADRIVASFFSSAEQAEFATITDDARSVAFLRGWTRKEAILKGMGIGLAGLAAHYETRFATSQLEARFVPAVPAPKIEEWQLWESAPRAGFVAALAVRRS